MIITPQVLDGIQNSFSTAFNKGFQGAPSQYGQIAMTAPSSTRQTTYAWLGQLPSMREWVGDRVIKSLASYGYAIENKLFESTIEVARTDIEDDQYGVYGPIIADMGRVAGENPDVLTFNLVAQGFDQVCYDGQNFFDAEHPVLGADGQPAAVSNMQDGAGPAWFLFDTSRPIRPMIFQERIKPEFQRLDASTNNEHVFMRDQFLYGVRARSNVGFGLWQLAFASKAPLTAVNYAAARQAMMSLRGDEGRLLGVKPDTLVIPPGLEADGLALLNSALIDASTNPWAGTAKLVLSPWLAD